METRKWGNEETGPIRAVFLDRDGVICHRHIARSEARNRAVAELVGRPDLCIGAEDELRVFWKAFKDPRSAAVVTPEQEEAFWWRWGETMLAEFGMTDGAKAARELCARYPYHTMLEAYPEVAATLDALKARNYRLGVISNTFPSLEASIDAMGFAQFFEAFISSALIGASKPDPRIYQAALDSLGVRASESVFVDDVRENADAARDMGFSAFRLDRQSEHADCDNWTIHSLTDLVDYLEEHDA